MVNDVGSREGEEAAKASGCPGTFLVVNLNLGEAKFESTANEDGRGREGLWVSRNIPGR
jgi:hypothetical protein